MIILDIIRNPVFFRIKEFPIFSETFVIRNIIDSINRGYQVTIIVDKINSIKESSQPRLIGKYNLLEKCICINAPRSKVNRIVKALLILVHPLKLWYFLKYCRIEKKKSLAYVFIIQFYWRFRKQELFHVHFAPSVHPLLELKKIGLLKRSKIIVTFHGYDAHYLPKGEKLNTLVSDFKNYVNSITVNSSYLKNKLISKGFIGKSISIIPIGYNSDLFNIKEKKNISSVPFKLISVGRLISLKGLNFGINAIKLLVNKEYEIQYTIVGDGEEYDALKKQIKENNLEKVVKLLGSKNQLEIKELLENQHLFLMPSTKDKDGRREAFGVVSLEAQAMGVPIIGFDSGGFPDTIIEGETGFIVEDKNIEAMAKKIEYLIKNNNLLNIMSKKAVYNVLTNFNSEKTTQQYFNFYE